MGSELMQPNKNPHIVTLVFMRLVTSTISKISIENTNLFQ